MWYPSYNYYVSLTMKGDTDREPRQHGNTKKLRIDNDSDSVLEFEFKFEFEDIQVDACFRVQSNLYVPGGLA